MGEGNRGTHGAAATEAARKARPREQGDLFREAFEWRFEIPGSAQRRRPFRGFDVVVGNPPYIRHEELPPTFKQHLKNNFATAIGTADLYVYFYELGLELLAPGGELSFITNNKWLRAGYGTGPTPLPAQPRPSASRTA